MELRGQKQGNFEAPKQAGPKGRTNRGPNFDYMFGVYRYDKDCKRLCPSTCDALPYLHCAVVLDKQEDGRYVYAYIVYVWDKRKALYKFERIVDADTARTLKDSFRSEYLLQARDELKKVDGQPAIFDKYLSK